MKIAHVITRLIVGGAQENTLFTVDGLLRRGHRVVLISGPSEGPEGSLEPYAREHNIPLLVIKELTREIAPAADLRAYRRLKEHFTREHYDIIHTHSAKAGVLGRIAAKRASPGARVIHTVHGPSFFPHQRAVLNWFYVNAERFAGRYTDHFICVGEIMKQSYLNAGIGRENDYSVVYSGFDLAPYAAARAERGPMRARLGIGEHEPVIGMIGRLFHQKGQQYLMEAFAETVRAVPSARLLLVGDGILRRELEDYASARAIADRVIFTGLVPPAEIPLLVAAMDALAHASLREGIPKAVAQGFAGGKPVAAFDADGARELVIDGETGFLIPPKNTGRLAEKLIFLLQNPETARLMGERGNERVNRLFPVEKMVDSIEKIYYNISQ